jgi:hypothetical protein
MLLPSVLKLLSSKTFIEAFLLGPLQACLLVSTGGRPPRKQRYKPQLTAATYRYFIRGQSDKAAADDFKVSQQKRIQLKAYDKLLKSFQYREALDAAISTDRPEIVSSIVEELAARSGLPAALGKPSVAAFGPPCIFRLPHVLLLVNMVWGFWPASLGWMRFFSSVCTLYFVLGLHLWQGAKKRTDSFAQAAILVWC